MTSGTNSRGHSHRTQLIFAFAIVYLVWGSTYLAIRYAILTIPPFLMAGTRFLLAGAALYAWARLRGTPRPSRRHWRNTSILGALLLLCGNGSVVWAEQTVPSGIAALLVATVPLWLVVFEWGGPTRTKPSTGVIAGVVIGMIGMLTLVGVDGLRGHGDISVAGTLALLFGSVCWAAGSLYSRYMTLPSAVMTTALEMLSGGAMLLIAAVVTGELTHFNVQAISLTSALGTLYLIVIGSIVAYTAYTWLLTAASPAAVGTYAYVNPVVAIFLGWWIAQESITVRTLLGAAIIVAAVGVITTARSTRSSR